MFRRIKFIILAVVILSTTFVGGCKKTSVDSGSSKKVQDASQNVEGTKEDYQKDLKKNPEVKFWTYASGFDDAIKSFEEANPDIKVKIEIFEYDKCKEEYMKALTSGEGPDVLMFDSQFFGQYTINGILQDLLEDPFGAGKYQKDFLGWESGLSLDNKHLLSITLSTGPIITMYRADIMKENGFPSEPEEFGRFIENADNIIAIARKLKEQDKFIFQFPTDLTDVVGGSLGFFDENLNYARYGDLYCQAMNIAKEAHKYGWEAEAGFYDGKGKEAIKNNKLVMTFNISSFAMSNLKEYVPEQKGKWRVTKSPLGVAAWSSDSRLAINAQSTNKEQAWKFMEYMVTQKYDIGNTTCVVGYIPSHKNPKYMQKQEEFFGGQLVYPLLEDITTKMVQYKLTPMDDKARELYSGGIWEATESNINSTEVVAKTRRSIDAALVEEKRALTD